jgi:hypothetical protein
MAWRKADGMEPVPISNTSPAGFSPIAAWPIDWPLRSGASSPMKVKGFAAPSMLGPPPSRSLCSPVRASNATPASSFGTRLVR